MRFNQIIKVCGDVDYEENRTGFYGERDQGTGVESIRSSRIREYHVFPAFKIAAVQANQAGHIPMEIFVQTGFYLELIGQETPKRCLERWWKTYASSGEAGLLEERRGREAQKDRLVVSYRLRKSSVLPRLVSSFWKPRMNS
ncbi:hypothetical protein AOU00_00120 [Paenibacillus polymyxa]|nr:hypothetical protein AOU00_00120 [Paenibacillus polymyxa]